MVLRSAASRFGYINPNVYVSPAADAVVALHVQRSRLTASKQGKLAPLTSFAVWHRIKLQKHGPLPAASSTVSKIR